MNFFKIDKELGKIETDKEVLTLSSLFIPFFIEMVLRNMLGTVNTITLGHYSDNAVAAVGAASQLMNMVYTFYAVVCTGATIVISQNLGANRSEEAGDAAAASLILSGVLSLILGTVLAVFAEPIMSLMQIKDELLAEASVYFRICISFSFIQAGTSALSAILRSYGRPKAAVTVALLMNIVNAILNIIVVYRPFETPLHGVSGVAISCVISEITALILLIILFLRINIGIQFKKSTFKSLKIIKDILYVGVPSGVTSLSYSMSQVVSTSIIAVLGVSAISTKVYLSNIFFYVYALGLALGQATSMMVSRLVGAQEFDKAYRLNKQNLKITIFCNIVVSLLIFLFGDMIIRIFTDNPEIIAISRTIMFIDLFVEIGRGFNHIEGNSLCGAGDVVFQMNISILSCWLMSIVFSYILGIKLGLGLTGCWIAFAMDEIFRGIIFYFRWVSRKWTKKSLIQSSH